MQKEQTTKIDIVRIQMVREGSLEYDRKAIRGPQDLAELGQKLIQNSDREVFLLVCLNTRNHINCIQVVSIGTVNTALVAPREVMKTAILCSASGIACIHNHPSGDPDPSADDIQITNRIAECGKLFGIELIDHVIIADEGKYESFREKGLLSKTLDSPLPQISEKNKTPSKHCDMRHETRQIRYTGEDELRQQYCHSIGCRKNIKKRGKITRKLARFNDFTELMKETALTEMGAYPEAEIPEKEAKDLRRAEMHIHFVLEDLVKKIIRFRNEREEKDLFKLALWAYLLWTELYPKPRQRKEEKPCRGSSKPIFS